MQEARMRPWLCLAIALVAGLIPPASSHAACCYFSAKNADISQPAQKAFLTWDPAEKVETFTVQPKFEGNAGDFGMVIPTPAKPSVHEMPREFFKELAVFTILEPMDLSKYKLLPPAPAAPGVVPALARAHSWGASRLRSRCWRRGSSARWSTRSSKPRGPMTSTTG